jgi:NAD(P)-dependent dehydrogenase (short-subunit alcohol dehydrogenase family)
MKECAGRVAVVTGAASGIGRGMAEAFVAAGMKVVLSDVEEPALEETRGALAAAGGDVHAVRTDVSRQEDVDALAQETLRRYGAVHVLCNNAGIGAMPGDAIGGSSWGSSLADWHWIIGVNLMGVVHGVRAFVPIMIAQDSEAHIVNTASVAGLIPGGTLYGTTKFAVVGLSENLSLELQRGGFKLRVSVLCPGLVDTRIIHSQRNRPTEFGPPTPQPPATQALLEWFEEQLKKGTSPRAIGEQVLAGIRDERFYILTHPQYNAQIEARVTDMLSGRNPTPPPGMDLEALMKRARAASTS